MLKDDTARNRLLGIGLVSITFLCFAVLDTAAKWLVLRLPVIEVVWLRFVGHVPSISSFVVLSFVSFDYFLIPSALHSNSLPDRVLNI